MPLPIEIARVPAAASGSPDALAPGAPIAPGASQIEAAAIAAMTSARSIIGTVVHNSVAPTSLASLAGGTRAAPVWAYRRSPRVCWQFRQQWRRVANVTSCRMRIAIASVLLALVAGTAGVHATATIDSPRPGPSQRPSADDVPGTTFTSFCGFSHRNFDDMIVFPGRHGRAHDHTYVGNKSTNADSTLTSLRRAGTTCQRKADTAAYWVPTLLDPAGQAVEPTRAVIYYRRRTVQPAVAFPPGLRMIAGDSMATTPQPVGTASWSCSFSGSHPMTASMPRCPAASRTMLAFHVAFPNCWNGRDLDSADHQEPHELRRERHLSVITSGRNARPSRSPCAIPSAEERSSNSPSGGQLRATQTLSTPGTKPSSSGSSRTVLNTLAHCGRGG